MTMVSAFEHLQISPRLTGVLREAGITAPTPVQEKAIPAILEGRDAIVQSRTGTGKTLAYLLPVLQRIEPASKAVQAVVLVPTHELGMQIIAEIGRFAEATGIRSQPLIGGASLSRQVDRLKLHPQLVVGTPGRVLELIRMRKLSMHHVRTIVVDEADQVFDLGSTGEVEAVLGSALRDRQILFFSATVPQALEEVSRRWMRDPRRIEVQPGNWAAETVEHVYFVCEERDKLDMLRRIVRLYEPRSAIVFINEVDDIAEAVAKMKYAGLPIEALYGEAGKQERARVMKSFREGRFQLLLATDIAARGLDIPGLPMVIHLDPAADADHYVHRTGRTGRMGRSGTAVSIVTPGQQFILEKFARALGIEFRRKFMYQGKLLDRPPVRGKRETRRPPGPGKGKQPETKAGTASAKKSAASPAVSASAGRKTDRHRDRKNKGAPRWLKEKRKGPGE